MIDLSARVRALIARELHVHVGQVVDNVRLDRELGADHIDVVSLVMEIEDEFGIKVSDDAMEALNTATVAEVIALVIDAAAPAQAA